MRRISLSILAGPALVFALFLAAGCGERGETVARVQGSALSLEAQTEPATPRTGDNRMQLRVLGADGKPVSDAIVDVKVVMPAMGAMPAMGGAARVKPMGDGRYEADFPLDMAGTYRVDVRVRDASGAVVAAEGSLITGQPGLRLSARGGGGDDAQASGANANAATTAHPGEVVVDRARRQKSGVRIAPVVREAFGVTIRAVGIVGYDQGAIHDVVPRVMGYVGDVQVPAAGNSVHEGDLLFTLYSPDLLAAQKEFLTARASQRGDALAGAAASRLRLWGMSPGEIERVAQTGIPLEYVSFRAPASGVVIEKNVVRGSGAQAGERLFRIATVDHVWIEAELYESDVALVKAGESARITLPYLPGERFEGKVSLVSPFLDGTTRTARARIEIGNPGHALLPGMYASVELRRELGERLVVPASAVLYAGQRKFVFVDLGEGRLRPQAVETGLRDGERLEVLSGLEAGQSIVVSGNYLIASESRLSSALEQW